MKRQQQRQAKAASAKAAAVRRLVASQWSSSANCAATFARSNLLRHPLPASSLAKGLELEWACAARCARLAAARSTRLGLASPRAASIERGALRATPLRRTRVAPWPAAAETSCKLASGCQAPCCWLPACLLACLVGWLAESRQLDSPSGCFASLRTSRLPGRVSEIAPVACGGGNCGWRQRAHNARLAASRSWPAEREKERERESCACNL